MPLQSGIQVTFKATTAKTRCGVVVMTARHPTLVDLPSQELEAVVIRAHLAALQSMGTSHAPLTHRQCIAISFSAIHADAMLHAGDFHPSGLKNHLAIVGVRAIHEAQAGMMDRGLLVERIEALSPEEKAAYSLRYEHDLSDRAIASALGITEDAVVALMLRALLKLTGVRE